MFVFHPESPIKGFLMFEVCTHRDELSEGDHLLAFSDGVEELVLHAG